MTPSPDKTRTLDPLIDRSPEQRLDDTFAALANETRRAILTRLAEGEAGVNELAAPFNLSLPAVSKHLKVLERAGLVTRTRRAQYRPCTLTPEPLAEVAAWTEHYRPIWENRLDQLHAYLDQVQSDSEPARTQPARTKSAQTKKASEQ